MKFRLGPAFLLSLLLLEVHLFPFGASVTTSMPYRSPLLSPGVIEFGDLPHHPQLPVGACKDVVLGLPCSSPENLVGGKKEDRSFHLTLNATLTERKNSQSSKSFSAKAGLLCLQGSLRGVHLGPSFPSSTLPLPHSRSSQPLLHAGPLWAF